LNTWSNRVTIEKDPTTKKLEAELFQQMAEILKPVDPKPIESKNEIKSVSVEDAIKELLELEKTSQRD